jgi:hypothetical protein
MLSQASPISNTRLIDSAAIVIAEMEDAERTSRINRAALLISMENLPGIRGKQR